MNIHPSTTFPQKPKRLPVVLTQREARALINELSGTAWLIVSLFYGTGMRLMEWLHLKGSVPFIGYQPLVAYPSKKVPYSDRGAIR